MNKSVEILLTALALAGIFCAMPKTSAPTGNPVIRAERAVLIADGSDPMPFHRGGKSQH
jgi:hypothetical protein